MESSIFKFVLRHSRKEQIRLVLFTLVAFPFLYFSLDLPKTIINQAIGGDVFPREFLGYSLSQVPYLMSLCGIFLGLVFINGGFKYYINVYRGVVGERMLRRLRYQLLSHVLRFPLPQFRKLSQGEIVAMITAETEPLGGYIGDSIALPVFQGGTLLTILAFMFVQDWVLGSAAIALYPIQGWLIPKLQRRVNLLKKERVLKVRKLSERIGEIVSGIRDVHGHDTSQFELADYSRRLGEIYSIRLNIYRQKFFIKFINNFIAQVTPFFFYSIGGYLVIMGNLSFGALVAVLAAYKDLSSPWKELLQFYQIKEDSRIKYELLLETFQPHGLLDEHLQLDNTVLEPPLPGTLVASNLNLNEEGNEQKFGTGASFTIALPQNNAILGHEGSGKHRLTDALAVISRPDGGSLLLGDTDLIKSPESITGRVLSFVGQNPNLRSGTVRENLFYALKHRPIRPPDHASQGRSDEESNEAMLSGNSPFDVGADWIDYQAIGLDSAAALTQRGIEVLSLVDMEDDIYRLGLQGSIDQEQQPDLALQILQARRLLNERLTEKKFKGLVEPFDVDAYNSNMSVAENLLFGAALDPDFSEEQLPDNERVLHVLREFGLIQNLLAVGREVATLMLDLFAGVEPGSPLFEQYSFISADDLPLFRALLSRTDGADLNDLSHSDQRMLLSLPLKLVVARHRLGLIDESFQERLVEARRVLTHRFGTVQQSIEPFNRETVNSAVSIQDNILFGRIVHGRARSGTQVGALLSEVVDQLKLRATLIEAGLDYNIGIGGARLSASQRQKLAIARAVIKRPHILVLDEPTAALDAETQRRIRGNLFAEFADRTVIWLISSTRDASEFDKVIIIDDGKVVEHGSPAELDHAGTMFKQLFQHID